MNKHQFRNLSTSEIAEIVRQNQLRVVVFVVNGSRRWFLLEHQDQSADYIKVVMARLIELSKMIFDHGIETLVMPTVSPYILDKRGDVYTAMAIKSLDKLTYMDEYLAFYHQQGVRVRFYGDYLDYLEPDTAAYLDQRFKALTSETLTYEKHKLWWGVCAHDAFNTVAKNSVQFFEETGRVPSKEELIAMYYGEYVPPVDLYISSSKLRAFDMPLISTGRESLYYTVAPSPYMTEMQFRDILHDHLFQRTATNVDFKGKEADYWRSLKTFYEANQNNTIGVGARSQKWNIWYPIPQVEAVEES